jgi:flagellum-specific ATP synthase
MQTSLDDIADQLQAAMPTLLCGSVARTVGMTAGVADFPAPVGAQVEIERQTGGPVAGEVIGFRDDLTLVYLLSDAHGLRRGNRVRLVRTSRWIRVGNDLLGRIVNAQGQAIDGRAQPALEHRIALDRAVLAPIERPRIATPLSTGIRAIDGLLTCGKGQRIGIFAGSGVGKSVALGMMSRYTAADVNVVALVGERGREVNEFVERDLGPGLAKSVVVVATSDEPALSRVRAAFTATAIAEYFRDQGKDVLLVMDSLTRWALAQREIGLAAGEPPTTRGFPPSVFGMLPKLLERAGRTARGSITGFYSVLVEGDDPNEPISDAVRGLLDGHTWLARKLAARGHYPAIDVLESVSRLMIDVVDPKHRAAAQKVRELLAVYREHEDLISVGAYRRGSNPAVDLAIDMQGQINDFLRQEVDEPSSVERARESLVRLLEELPSPSPSAPPSGL